MFSHLVCRFLLVVLPLAKAVQIPVGNNFLPHHYPDFHKEFFDNINHLTQIDRHNVEYIKPSIELGSFTIQTVIPANGPNYNQQNNNPEFALQNGQGQHGFHKNNNHQTQNSYLPPTNNFNEGSASDVGETNGYLPPYMQLKASQEQGINYNSTSQVQAFAIPKPTFLQNLMRPLFENEAHQRQLKNNAFQQNQVHERKPVPAYQPTPYQNLPVNNAFQQFNPQRTPHQTYGPAPLITNNQIQTNFVADRRPLQDNIQTQYHDNTVNERRSFQPQAIQNHNHIQTQIQGNTLRQPHQNYGPQLSTIERRDQSEANDISDKIAFQQFKNQVDSLNKKLSRQSSSQQLIDPVNFKRIEKQTFSNQAQKIETERKPHQTYGPLQSIDNDKIKSLNQFVPQTGTHTNLLQTNFLPKTDDELEQNLNNDNSINTEKFPPNEDSTNLKSKSIESNQQHQQNSGGIDTKYSSDGGYIY